MRFREMLGGSHEYRIASAEAKAAAARARALAPWYRKIPFQALFVLATIYAITFDATGHSVREHIRTRIATVAASVTDGASVLPDNVVSPALDAQPPHIHGEYDLALVSATCMEHRGLNKCSGTVKNLLDHSLANVEVAVSWVDATGATTRTDTAVIAQNPLPPGQQSSWETTGESDQRVGSYRIVFREPIGGPVSTRDDRR